MASILSTQMYRDLGVHGYDYERMFWEDALGHSIDAGSHGVLVVVLGEEYGGATEFLSSREYDLLSVFLTKARKRFLKDSTDVLKWGERSVDGEVHSLFGVRELDEDFEMEEGEIKEGGGGQLGEGAAAAGEGGEGAVEKGKELVAAEEEGAEEEEEIELEVSPVAYRTRMKKADP